MLTKLLAGALALSFLFMSVITWRSHVQSTQLKEKTALLLKANESITMLNASLKKQAEIAKTTDKAVTEAVQKTSEVTQKATELSNKVVSTNQGVVHGKIDSTVADAIYTDSMWSAYCEAKPSDIRCATRRPNPRLSSR